jgi:hypothetical protein
MNEIVRTLNGTQLSYHEKLAKFAAETGGNELPGLQLKFAQGDWLLEDVPAVMDHLYVAQLRGITMGWVRWKKGEDIRRIPAPLGTNPLERHELGDLDEATWDFNKDGVTKDDPWQLKTFIGLLRHHDGEPVVFSTKSHGGRKAIGQLAAQGAQEPEGVAPIVMLSSSSYINKRYGGKTHNPVFKVLKWANEDGTPLTAETQRAIVRAETLDDDIPF